MGLLVNGSSAEGKKLRESFLSGFPKLNALIESLKTELSLNNGWIAGVDNRRIYVGSDHKLLNYLLQGNEAIYIKYTAVIANKLIKKNGLDAKLLVIMHDEINMEVSLEDAENVKKILKYAFKRAGEVLGIMCPMDTDPKQGETWYDIH